MLFATLITPWDSRKWLEFSDTEDYLAQSKIPITREFWAPHHSGSFSPRPFTVPLIYKLAGSEPVSIVLLQKYIHCLSTWFLVFSLLLLINTTVFRYFLMISVYILMSWWTIAGWTNQILSESLSLSFLFCWIASFILAWKKRKWYFWVVHILIMILFSFTRDTWPYMLILWYPLFSFSAFLWERSLLKPLLVISLLSVVLFFVQQNTARTGQRYRVPMLNIITVRIICNDEYTEWFKARGMPCTDSLVKKYRYIDINLDPDRHKIWNLYGNTEYEPLWKWVLDKGKAEYMKFLVAHPSYTFLIKETDQQRKRIFAWDLWYAGEVAGYSTAFRNLFPIFSPWWILVVNLLLIVQFFRKKKLIMIFPVMISFVFMANVFISYNSDALEVERHLFITVIMIHLIIFLALAILADSLFNKRTHQQTLSV
jgi:hypothetical protein